MKKVIVYSTPSCPYCTLVKNFLKEHNIKFEDKNVAFDRAAREEMIQKTGQLGVPVIDIDEKVIIGFNEEQLRQLLNIK